MKICIDKNHLLVIENENIPQLKEYSHTVSGYIFSDFDKGLFVLHKKNWKIINLKNLGERMNVVYVKNNKSDLVDMDIDSVKQAFGLFSAFDETSGQTYFFVPAIGDKELEEKNQIMEKLDIEYRLKKTDKGVIVDGIEFVGTEKRISFLFGLLLLYGKFDTRKGELASVKIQLPLFGQYLKYTEVLDKMMSKLQEHGIFMKSNKLETNNGIIYQISCNDYELLEIFAKWYERVEKFEKITKSDFTQKMKDGLLDFIKNDKDIPEEGKNEVIELIEKGMIKLLAK